MNGKIIKEGSKVKFKKEYFEHLGEDKKKGIIKGAIFTVKKIREIWPSSCALRRLATLKNVPDDEFDVNWFTLVE